MDAPTPEVYARNARCKPGLYVPASWTSTSSDGLAVSEPAIGGLFVSPNGDVQLLHGWGYLVAPSQVIHDIAHATQPASRGPWETQETYMALGARMRSPELEDASTTFDNRFGVEMWAYIIGDAIHEVDDAHIYTKALYGEAVVE